MTKHSLTFSIPKPCSESWLHMAKEERGNFCQSCQKTVIDFSRMSDEDIIRTIKNTKGSICGRFNNTQLNRPMYFSYSANVQRHYPLKTLLAGIMVLTLIQPPSSEASVVPVESAVAHSVTSAAQSIPNDSTVAVTDTLKGRVVEENFNLGIDNARIYIEGSKDTVVTDAEGRFSMAIPSQVIGKPFTIEVILPGRTKSYFLINPEELTSTKEQLFLISHEKYQIDGLIMYDERSEGVEHDEIVLPKEKIKKKKR